MAGETESVAPPPHAKLKGLGLLIASALVSINIWTGAPLLAVWVGSRIQAAQNGLSMGALLAVVAVLGVSVFILAWVLAQLNGRYDKLSGRPQEARQASPWLRSMRGERETDLKRKQGISGIERVVIISVVAAVLCFEIWFFFFAGASLPNA